MSQDRELEDYLKGSSPLSDAYAELQDIKLPDHLDAAILAEAHRAVHARPGGRPHRSWMVPLSMAASLFVVVVIGFQWRHLQPVFTQPSPTPPPEARSPAPEQDESEIFKAAPNAATRDSEAPAGLTETPSTQAQSRQFSGGKQQAAPVLPRVPVSAEPAAPAREADAVKAEAVAPSPAMAPPPAAEAPMMLQEEAPARRSSSSGMDRIETRQPAAGKPAMKQKRLRVAPEAIPESRMMQEGAAADERVSPEAWLKRIAKLKQQGKLPEARKELADFRKRYPEYHIPRAIEAGL